MLPLCFASGPVSQLMAPQRCPSGGQSFSIWTITTKRLCVSALRTCAITLLLFRKIRKGEKKEENHNHRALYDSRRGEETPVRGGVFPTPWEVVCSLQPSSKRPEAS